MIAQGETACKYIHDRSYDYTKLKVKYILGIKNPHPLDGVGRDASRIPNGVSSGEDSSVYEKPATTSEVNADNSANTFTSEATEPAAKGIPSDTRVAEDSEAVKGENASENRQHIDNAANANYTGGNNTDGGIANGATAEGARNDAEGSSSANNEGVSGVHQDGEATAQGRTGLGGVSGGTGRALSPKSVETIENSGVVYVDTNQKDNTAFSFALKHKNAVKMLFGTRQANPQKLEETIQLLLNRDSNRQQNIDNAVEGHSEAHIRSGEHGGINHTTQGQTERYERS